MIPEAEHWLGGLHNAGDPPAGPSPRKSQARISGHPTVSGHAHRSGTPRSGRLLLNGTTVTLKMMTTATAMRRLRRASAVRRALSTFLIMNAATALPAVSPMTRPRAVHTHASRSVGAFPHLVT